ncbi:MAG: YtxH domain-containing protein [Rubrobacteraceae bacterium]
MIDKQRLRTFILGGAIGALVGVLLAPRSGRELRGNLANRAGEARERSRETYFEAQERLQERLAETREGAFRPADDGPEPAVSGGKHVPRTEPDPFVGPPKLREVSSETYDETPSGVREEELRRKVQETRSRLRERLESSGRDEKLEGQDE